VCKKINRYYQNKGRLKTSYPDFSDGIFDGMVT